MAQPDAPDQLARQVFSAYDGRSDGRDDGARFCPRCRSELASRSIGGRERKACPGCSFVLFRNPAPAISVLVVEGDSVALCRRRSATFGVGKWCLPCGYIEYDEDFLTAAVREVKEETGLDVSIKGIVSAVTNFLTPNAHTLVIVLVADRVGGELAAGDDDVDAVGWFSVQAPLPELAFEADGHIIQRYFATRLAGAPVDERYAGGA